MEYKNEFYSKKKTTCHCGSLYIHYFGHWGFIYVHYFIHIQIQHTLFYVRYDVVTVLFFEISITLGNSWKLRRAVSVIVCPSKVMLQV